VRVDKCDTAQRFYLVFICGVASMIEIIVAYDTLNIGLIVDGTGHALALQVLRERNETIINGKKR
jgi:hypothetical protein